MEKTGQLAEASALCDVQKVNGLACDKVGQYECESGHRVCFFHSIRTIGANSVENRKCVPCMDAGKTSFVHRLRTAR